jgi:hypothetical protein
MRRLTLVPLLLLLAAGGGAAAGGPSPGAGIVVGGPGVVAPDGTVRYVTIPGNRTTTVAAIRVRDGLVLRWSSLRGTFGVPLVATDGTTEGVSADGGTLVVATYPGAPSSGTVTRLAVVSTRTLRPVRTIALHGSFTYDALSPDGRTAYLIEYRSADYASYRVRALDLASGHLVPGAIVDKREPDEAMQGSPLTRRLSRDGGWAYTLYSRKAANAFVHALDTRHRSAVCVDLPFRLEVGTAVRMALSADGTQLVLRRAGATLATVDTTSFEVKALRKP